MRGLISEKHHFLLGGILAVFSLGALSATPAVSYDITTWAPVTIALTLNTQTTNVVSTIATTKKGIPYSSTNYTGMTVNTKFGNKEFLDGLISNSVISGPAKDWIIYASTTTNADSSGVNYDDLFVVNKKNTAVQPVDINQYLRVSKAYAKDYDYQIYTTYAPTNSPNAGAVTFASRTGKGNAAPEYTYGGPVGISYVLPGLGSNNLVGTFKGVASEKVWYPNSQDKTTYNYIAVPGGGNVSGIAGVGTLNNNRVLITGSISFGACKASMFFKQ